jgi:hypothetical protein
MNYTYLSENAARQWIDSSTVFDEFCRAQQKALPYAGGMYWKRQGEYDYLVKTSPDNKQIRLGKRCEVTESTYTAFHQHKREAEERLKSLKAALQEAQRVNRALKVGRVPTLVIDVLNVIHEAGLSQHFTVVGTHALYAYETAAGVRITPGALATQDVDLLWDARRRVKFFTNMARLNTSILGILQRADPTFQRRDDQLSTAINNKGFEIDFLRRQAQGDDPHPVQLSADESDLWAVQATNASILTDAPRFEQVVASVTGKMARMVTIDPAVFVNFKRWMAEQTTTRPAAKRRRDVLQAAIVQDLMNEKLLLGRDA